MQTRRATTTADGGEGAGGDIGGAPRTHPAPDLVVATQLDDADGHGREESLREWYAQLRASGLACDRW